VVHGIVQAHGGVIVVVSRVDCGTTIHIYLPAAAREDIVTAAPVSAQPPPRGHGEHVLFVDDEPALVSLGKDLLGDLGYRVSGYTSVHDALAAFRADPHDVDVVVSDLTMPEMSGVEFAGALLTLRPELPIILATGYSGALSPAEIRASGIRALLIKPVVLDIIAVAVHEHLCDQRPPGRLS
jgi:CheY-like chemotaxis protein